MDEEGVPRRPPFLIMEGGPLYNLQRRVGLIRQNAPLRVRFAAITVLFTWVPLLVLSAIQGRAYGHLVAVPFFHDFSVWTRFMLAVPLLVVAENVLGPRIAEAAAHFVTSGVVIEKDYKRFDEIVVSGLRERDAVLPEVIIAILAYTFSVINFTHFAVRVNSWYALGGRGGASLTWAGCWLVGFCMPLFQFLILRWLWRLFLWFQFLARVRRLDIQLFPTHPDQAGGLGFVGESQRFFGVILFAMSSASTGVLANNIVYDHVPLATFGPAIAAYVVVTLIIFLGPLVLFTERLLQTKRIGLLQYGTLGMAYTRLFHGKWIEHQNLEHDSLLGSGDIQSLADLGNSYELIRKMKALPIDPRTVIQLVAASLLPMLPLLLTVMSPKDVLKLIFKLLA